jgi:hypothetical protein
VSDAQIWFSGHLPLHAGNPDVSQGEGGGRSHSQGPPFGPGLHSMPDWHVPLQAGAEAPQVSGGAEKQ